ncbi:histidine phosphatase family protein [Burkholderiaceae bacterium UC74_6]
MATLTLVRHGQASFGAHDYDQLSARGEQQCRLLGEYWRARGRRFDAVLMGTLKRHAQSLAAINVGLGSAPPTPQLHAGLDEYDSAALIQALRPDQPLAKPTNAEEVKAWFRVLREALRAWAAGAIEPVGMKRYAEFSAGVADALEQVRRSGLSGHAEVLIVSSGGPISTAVAQVLGAPFDSAIEMNLRLRNSALSEFSFTPKRHVLHSFNQLPHLDGPDAAGLETYA